MTRRGLRPLVALTAAIATLGLVVLACGEGGGSDLLTVSDSAGIRVVTNAGRGDGGQMAFEDLSVGVVEGDPAYMLGRVSALAVGAGDTIYVLDSGEKHIKVYDPSGRHVRTFGREGDGPGEFREPNLMTLLGDTLVVFDWRARRLTYLRGDGTVLGTARTELPATFAARIARLDDTTLVLQANAGHSMPPQPERDGKSWLLRLTLDGRVLDTLLVTAGTDQVPYRTERFLTVVTAPFPRGPRWDAAPDRRIAYGRGEHYQIGVHQYPPAGTDSIGRLVMLIRRAESLRAVTDADIASYRNRWLDREDLTPESRRRFEDLLDTVTYPATWQAFDDLRFDASGRLWVRRPPREADSLVSWDVFDPDGRLVRVITLPKDLTVHAIGADAVYGVMRDELDVQYVKRLRLP